MGEFSGEWRSKYKSQNRLISCSKIIMALLKIKEDNEGLTYTLEAILGIFIIVGAVMYTTGNMPPMAHKAGHLSKVQLMNIGRDTLDLIVITPEYETSQGEPVEIYNLAANKYANINPGENINFTVYYATTGIIVNRSLNFNATPLIVGDTLNITSNVYFQNDGTGHQLWQNVPSPPGIIPTADPPEKNFTYSILAYDDEGGMSNLVTIKVGYYNLTLSNTTIVENGYVSGIVTDANNFGVSNLAIRIWKYQGSQGLIPQPSVTQTTGGNFSFQWPISQAGIYLIQAINTTTSKESNMQVIEYPGDLHSGGSQTLCASYLSASSCNTITVPERSQVSLYMQGSDVTFPGNYFYVDYKIDAKTTIPDVGQYITTFNTKNATFYANVPPGIYSVVTCTPGCENRWSNAFTTNFIFINVLPISSNPIGNTCVNATALNSYIRNYLPLYINYNLYMIGVSGNRFSGCPNFKDTVIGEPGQVINGYPTSEAVTVSKLVHITYAPTNVDNMVEYRMELWYT